MKVPFHALRLFPDAILPPGPLHALSTVLENPVVRVPPLRDAIGEPYAYDLVLEHGFYLLFLSWIVFRYTVRAASRGE